MSMKELIGFIGWKWKNFEFWQKMFIASVTVQMFSWLLPNPWAMIVNISAFSVVVFYMISWFVWKPMLDSWAKYKQHRNSLLETIKRSDQ